MKLKYDDGELTLIPETEADMNEIKNAFGKAYSTKRNHWSAIGYEMFETYGSDIYQLEDKSIVIRVKDAWWNYDD